MQNGPAPLSAAHGTRSRQPIGGHGRRMAPARERAPHVVGLLLAASLLSLLFFAPVVLAPAYLQNYYLALLLTGLTVLPLAVRIATRSLDIFEPIIPISLLIGLAFGLRAMYLAYAPVSILPIAVGLLQFDDFIGSALVLTIAAYGALVFGYYVVGGAIPVAPLWTRSGRKTWPARISGPRVAILLGIGALATAAIRATDPDEITGATNAVGIIAALVQITGCTVALYIATGDSRRWLRLTLWLVVVPLVLWQSIALGAKSPALLLFYAVIAARHYARRLIGMPLLAATVVIAVLVVFPAVVVYRVPSESPLSVSSATPTVRELVSRAAAIPPLLARHTPSEYLQLAAESVIARFSGIDAVSLLLKYDVSAELGDPAAYLYIPAAAFIPRVIWPDKPVLERGTAFGRLLLDPSFAGATWRSSFGMFHIGDLFATFGFTGLLVGMCALGCFYRLVYRFLDPRHSSDLGVKFIYIFLLWFMVSGFESDIPSIYANVLKSVAIWAVVKAWLNATPTQQAAGPRGPFGMRESVLRPGVTHAGGMRPSVGR